MHGVNYIMSSKHESQQPLINYTIKVYLFYLLLVWKSNRNDSLQHQGCFYASASLFILNIISTRKLLLLSHIMIDYLVYFLCASLFPNCLVSQVCGNGESVRFLNEWLGSWRGRYSRNPENSTRDITCGIEDSDYGSGEDSVAESMEERAELKNVLLVNGPVGVSLLI